MHVPYQKMLIIFSSFLSSHLCTPYAWKCYDIFQLLAISCSCLLPSESCEGGVKSHPLSHFPPLFLAVYVDPTVRIAEEQFPELQFDFPRIPPPSPASPSLRARRNAGNFLSFRCTGLSWCPGLTFPAAVDLKLK